MRTIFATALLISLAACDDGGVIDQTIQRGVRQSAVEACTAWIPESQIAAAAGLDGPRLCACAADRIMEGKDSPELADLRPDSPENRAAIVQCVGELQARARDARSG